MEAYGAGPFLKNTIPNLFAADFKKNQPELVADLIEKSSAFETRACQQYYRAMMLRPDRTRILKESGLPILFASAPKILPHLIRICKARFFYPPTRMCRSLKAPAIWACGKPPKP